MAYIACAPQHSSVSQKFRSSIACVPEYCSLYQKVMSYIACPPGYYSVSQKFMSYIACAPGYSQPCVPGITAHPHWLCIICAHATRKFLCSIHPISSSGLAFLALIITFSLVSTLRFIFSWARQLFKRDTWGLISSALSNLGFGSQHPEPGQYLSDR